MKGPNIAASVRARLLSRAKSAGTDFSLVLTRYALERLLYRLSISKSRDNFLLKGALLFDLWFDVPFRPTRDIDLFGFGVAETAEVHATFEEFCHLQVNDGVVFDAKSIQVSEIRKEANYAGLRVTLLGRIDGAFCPVQVDVGYGDAVTPAPELADYPVFFEEFGQPRLRVYPRYSVVAEKLEAIISLGMVNTRLKDYFDLWVILNKTDIDTLVLQQAVVATLRRRSTAVHQSLPMGLSDAFAQDAGKARQWRAFKEKNRLDAPELPDVLQDLRARLQFLWLQSLSVDGK
jgi:predicted nucleotidyltransferase component of viral defense system